MRAGLHYKRWMRASRGLEGERDASPECFFETRFTRMGADPRAPRSALPDVTPSQSAEPVTAAMNEYGHLDEPTDSKLAAGLRRPPRFCVLRSSFALPCLHANPQLAAEAGPAIRRHPITPRARRTLSVGAVRHRDLTVTALFTFPPCAASVRQIIGIPSSLISS